jgi:site-specific DNA-methyltransferase (adenine-specific)
MWLVKWLVERLTNKGDLVLDNFAGVGTTAAACKSLKRQFIAVEKSRKYVNAIKVRLAS